MDRVWRIVWVLTPLAIIGLMTWWALEMKPWQQHGVHSDSATKSTATKPLQASDLAGVGAVYHFTARIPIAWQAEAVPASQAINLYDPTAPGGSTLGQSQVFIGSFRASDFLTLQTVLVQSRETLEVDGHAAVRYVIEKRPEAPTFPNQPSWRNLRHTVTDVRTTNDDPAVFYVIAKRPELSAETYERFLASVSLDERAMASLPLEPVAQFRERMTKKFFGTHVAPGGSPITPERFRGYHTGIDVEYGDVAGDVSVRAIADGTVTLAKWASGYGGVAVIDHELNGRHYQVVYGYLDPVTLPKLHARVVRGEAIGHLGNGGTYETDGERKHLHFGVYIGTSPVIIGYVSTESQLNSWADPLSFY